MPTATPTVTPTPTETRIPITYLPLVAKYPTPTPTPTPTSTPTPVVHNGGFEIGDFSGWIHGGELEHEVVRGCSPSGTYGARLGDPDYACEGGAPGALVAWTYQTIQVPTGGDPILRFSYRVVSQDTSQWDFLKAMLRDANGMPLEQVLRVGSPIFSGCSDAPWDSTWLQQDFPLSDYRGQLVQLYFENRLTNDDGWFNTWSCVDDVQVTP